MATGEFAKCADLVDDIVDQFPRRTVDLAASESLQVVISRMCADADAMLDREPHRLVHEIGVAGMETRRDIG